MKIDIGVIADQEEQWPKAEFTAGHLYEWKRGIGKEPRLCVTQKHTSALMLVNIKTGEFASACNDRHDAQYRDVTDQFVLKRTGYEMSDVTHRTDTMPKTGQFIAIWIYNDLPWSAIFKWEGSDLMCYDPKEGRFYRSYSYTKLLAQDDTRFFYYE